MMFNHINPLGLADFPVATLSDDWGNRHDHQVHSLLSGTLKRGIYWVSVWYGLNCVSENLCSLSELDDSAESSDSSSRASSWSALYRRGRKSYRWYTDIWRCILHRTYLVSIMTTVHISMKITVDEWISIAGLPHIRCTSTQVRSNFRPPFQTSAKRCIFWLFKPTLKGNIYLQRLVTFNEMNR